MSVEVCKCCGHPIFITLKIEGVALLLHGRQKRFYELLAKAGEAGVTTHRLIDGLFANDIHGGPENPGNVISVMKIQLNKKLIPLGLRIASTRRWSHSATYRLYRL